MYQKEYKEIIDDALDTYYSEKLPTIEERIKVFSKAIKYCRLFKEEHNKDYRYKFYGKWIEFRESVLEGMDMIIEQAKELANKQE